MRLRIALVTLGIVLVATPLAEAQQPAASYRERFDELKSVEPAPGQIAAVTGLVLHRDVAAFSLDSGSLALLAPVGGRTVGAVFHGHGTFHFAPPGGIEQNRLERFLKQRSLDQPFTDLVLYFTDSTLAELTDGRTFGASKLDGAARDAVHQSLEFLIDDDSRTADPDFMADLLNGTSRGYFQAYIKGSGDPLVFRIDPLLTESVELLGRAKHMGYRGDGEVICQFPAQQEPPQLALERERVPGPGVSDYQIESTLDRTGSGDMSFAAKAGMTLVSQVQAGPWIPLTLFSKLEVDSAQWADGSAATVFKGDERPLLGIRLDHPIAANDSPSITLWYHGDLIDRFGDWFFIKSSVDWYPGGLASRQLARFDLTFHDPSAYLLASVGDRVDSTVSDGVLTTRWVTQHPIRNASFNLGVFKDYVVRADSVPPVDVLWSQIPKASPEWQFAIGGHNMKEEVGADVSNSLRFFRSVYGDYPVHHFYATEIPYPHGEAFPGLVHLSAGTFHNTVMNDPAFEKFFRAHEVAHQWWGIGVDFATYHDQWLSEGFASFSGLWYLQTVLHDNDKYFDPLDSWRTDILRDRDEASPIWLGYRTSTGLDASGYQTEVYEKGAWVVHMLRIMMLDLRTMNEDRFTGMMRDFYSSYAGRRASTADFQHVVERHVGVPLDWFFKQWVYGPAIPSYRYSYRVEPAEGGRFQVTMEIDQTGVPDDFRVYLPVSIDLGGGRIARVRVKVAGPHTETTLPLLPGKPKSIKVNDLDGVLAADVKER
jgi:hypothetical protein